MANKHMKISVFELVWYILTGLVALWGLTYIVLGLVASNLSSSSPLVVADKKIVSLFDHGFLIWGVIILAVAVVAAVIVLLIYAAKADRIYEKEQRRAARLAQIKASVSEEVVDVEVENK